jgi:hypothetical protein
MKRRNFTLTLTAAILAVVVLARGRLWQIGSRFFNSLSALRENRARLNETQKRIDAAKKDLAAIVQAELAHIKKVGKFATLDQLISTRDLGPEMAGRHGYVYSIHLEGNEISARARAYPAPGEQLPALVNYISGPGLAQVLATLQE